MKLIGISANETSRTYTKKKEGHYLLSLLGMLSGHCADAQKGLEFGDSIETTINIDIHEFIEWFDTKTINELKKALINHIKTK